MSLSKVQKCVVLFLLVVLDYSAQAFVAPSSNTRFSALAVQVSRKHSANDEEDEDHLVPADASRRSSLLGLGGVVASSLFLPFTAASADSTGAEVRGTQITPFNSLAFQYRGSDFGGLQLSDLNAGEASISYKDFMEKLKNGEVEFVEFLAPDGDVAYAKLKGSTAAAIRIGEGYPIEQHDGYSSPAFAIRAVQNAGVPYKFTVPGLNSNKS